MNSQVESLQYLQPQIPQELIINTSGSSSSKSGSSSTTNTKSNQSHTDISHTYANSPEMQNSEQQFDLSLTSTSSTNNTFKSYSIIDGRSAHGMSSDLSSAGIREEEAEMDQNEAQQPIFDFGMPRNLTGRTGHAEASIKCKVDRLHDKSVSENVIKRIKMGLRVVAG